MFGLSWTTKDTERTIARELLIYLEDRRVLYGVQEIEVFPEVVDSLCKIREKLTDLITKTNENSELGKSMRIMRQAFRKFLDDSRQKGRMPIYDLKYNFDKNKLFTLLGEIRTVFDFEILRLSLQYEIDIEENLYSISNYLILDNEKE